MHCNNAEMQRNLFVTWSFISIHAETATLSLRLSEQCTKSLCLCIRTLHHSTFTSLRHYIDHYILIVKQFIITLICSINSLIMLIMNSSIVHRSIFTRIVMFMKSEIVWKNVYILQELIRKKIQSFTI